MVLEVAILNVRRGEGEAFEAAFREAQRIIAASPGYQRNELRRCVEALCRRGSRRDERTADVFTTLDPGVRSLLTELARRLGGER